ncbi:MAG: pseudouridine synthase [Pseudomonadota bacterium]
MTAPSIRIQKLLATAGIASRRHIEAYIVAGRIRVNGKVAVIGQHITGSEKIELDGQIIPDYRLKSLKTLPRLLLYHKPLGVICTRHDPQGRSTVFEQLPELPSGRWIMVGRLDINTSGLLLFTNHGELAHYLMHPSQNNEREYKVRLLGKPDAAILKKLLQGVILEDGYAKFNHIRKTDAKKDSANQWYRVSISNGKNRIVRRLWQSQDIQVNRLIRVRHGDFRLPQDLKPGNCIEVNRPVVEKLLLALKPRHSLSLSK